MVYTSTGNIVKFNSNTSDMQRLKKQIGINFLFANTINCKMLLCQKPDFYCWVTFKIEKLYFVSDANIVCCYYFALFQRTVIVNRSKLKVRAKIKSLLIPMARQCLYLHMSWYYTFACLCNSAFFITVLVSL
jgi:hypothetical protein